MTRIDFYLLSANAEEKERLACRLAEKAFRLGHQVYVLAANRETAQRLDDLLWTFNPGSFVPHTLHAGEQNCEECPVLIGDGPPPPAAHDVLISFRHPVPEFFSRFTRLIELVGDDEEDKAQSRERFRFYRDRGYTLQTHQV